MGGLFSDILEAWDTNTVSYIDYLEDNHEGFHGKLYYEYEIVKYLAEGYFERVKKHERELELPEVTYGKALFRGFIDGRIADDTIVENKLKGQWTATDEQALLLDDQVTGYLAQYCQLTGRDPDHVELQYHVVRKPALRQKVNEEDDTFLQRCKDDIDKRPEHYYIFVPEEYTSRTEDDIVEWFKETFEVAQQMERAEQAGVWPRNTSACKQFGSLCEMFPICSANDSEVESVIKDKFKEKNLGR